MVNLSGVAAIGSALFRPGLVVPHLVVADIRSLSWLNAKRLGFDYIVFDKDNCLTSPYSDSLEPSLADSYRRCLQTFGESNVLVVSNSAGSSSDAGGVGAQHLSRMLYGTTVLCHPKKKPAKGCAEQVASYFQHLHQPSSSGSPVATSLYGALKQLFAPRISEGEVVKKFVKSKMGNVLVVGDRITTDTVTAHRISDILAKMYPAHESSNGISPQAVSVLTTTLWAKESLGNRVLRRAEAGIMYYLIRRGIQPGEGWKQQQKETSLSAAAARWHNLLESQPPATAPALPATAPPSSVQLLSDPTPSIYLASQLQRSSLPPWASKILTVIIANRLVGSTARFLRDGWLLILRGCREGLNRPSLVFEDSQKRSIWTTASRSHSRHPLRSCSTVVEKQIVGRSAPLRFFHTVPYYSERPNSQARSEYLKDEAITASLVQEVHAETGRLIGGARSPSDILAEIDRSEFCLLQITDGDEIPIVKVIRRTELYEMTKTRNSPKRSAGSDQPAEVKVTWLVTDHDLSHKLQSGKRHLAKKGPGSRVLITVSTKKDRKYASGSPSDKMAVLNKIEALMVGNGESETDAGIRVKRMGDVKWQEPGKMAAMMLFQAF